MGIKSKIESYITSIFVNRLTKWLTKQLEGKKTVIGAISLLLWVAIYAIPAFTPNYNWVTLYAVQIRDALQSAGIQLDNSLFNTGVGFTIVGLVDKIRRLIKGE